MTKNIKLAMHTADLSDEKFLALQDLFPEAVTETITTDENGERVVTRAIDADVLQQLINKKVVSGKEERYQFTWPDKKKAMLLANAPINKTLRPCREESVDFDNTENLYIEGDNLDVLKLLRETYLGKIKMIYIDPPYNTGNDFVYEDDFAEDTQEFLRRDNQVDEHGNRLVTNTESNGRFHTDWLNMMYPRLKLARDLLAEDGVMFISIDDNEVDNLRKLCDEVFGEEQFQANIVWRRKRGKDNSTTGFSRLHEYLIVYSKSNLFHPLRLEMEEERINIYKNPDNDIRGSYVMQPCWASGMKKGPSYDIEIGGYSFTNRMWLYSKNTIIEKFKDNRLVFTGQHKDGKPNVYLKVFLSESKGVIPDTIWYNVSNSGDAVVELKEVFNNEIVFSTPKPIEYIKRILKTGLSSGDITLDFFAGSSTTAHAVMQLNAEDNGNRKFILVQLPESTDEKSEAFKAGYKNICEIGKERIRRAGIKIKEEVGLTAQNLDIGFRVLKLDESNMNNVYYSPDEYKETNFKFEDLIENVKPDRTHEDILFQVMLELGVPLSAKINVDGNIITVDDNYLVACFDKVDSETVTRIAKMQPYYAVFRDSSFINDSSLINVDQIFNTYSPTTKRRVI